MPEQPIDNRALVLDLLRWIAEQPRPYEDVMDAWRTSCPRLTVWEDTLDAGLVRTRFNAGVGRSVSVTAAGEAFLRDCEDIA